MNQDPQVREAGKYAAFVKRLNGLHLVDVSLRPPEEFVTIFFVKKKGNKQRMILGCWLVNTQFKEPEGIQLASADSLSKMALPEGTAWFMASADLQNVSTQWVCLSKCEFCLRASDSGLEEVKPDRWVLQE